jgi:hypothetical protein
MHILRRKLKRQLSEQWMECKSLLCHQKICHGRNDQVPPRTATPRLLDWKAIAKSYQITLKKTIERVRSL